MSAPPDLRIHYRPFFGAIGIALILVGAAALFVLLAFADTLRSPNYEFVLSRFHPGVRAGILLGVALAGLGFGALWLRKARASVSLYLDQNFIVQRRLVGQSHLHWNDVARIETGVGPLRVVGRNGRVIKIRPDILSRDPDDVLQRIRTMRPDIPVIDLGIARAAPANAVDSIGWTGPGNPETPEERADQKLKGVGLLFLLLPAVLLIFFLALSVSYG